MGKIGLSAVSIGGDIAHFMTFLAMGFSNAGQVIISQYLGAGERKKLGRFIGTMFFVLILGALILSGVCFIFREDILHLMNTSKAAWEQTLAYAEISMLGLVFVYGYNIVSAVLRGLGDSKRPFVFISIAAVLNVVLDIYFVMDLGKGAGGAALATVISQGVSFLISAAYLCIKRKKLGFEISAGDFVKPHGESALKLVKLGVPMAIKSASIQFSKVFVNSWINSYGVAVSAMAGIANKFSSTANLVSNAVNTAGSSMVGQNIGAKKYKRVPRIMLTAFIITFIIATVLSAAVVIFPNAVFGLFTDDAEVMLLAKDFIPIAVILFYASSFRAAMNALINGSGNYIVNFATAILDGLILRIGLALLFGLTLGMEHTGFWLGDALAGFTPFFIGLVYYLSGSWKKKNVV